jgi:NitT/TauT family transport system substrate-binding protein
VEELVKLKKLAALVSAAVIASTAAACSGNSAPDAGSMKVMMYPAVAYRLPVILAQEKGMFEDHGVTVEIVPKPNNLQGIQAMEATDSQAVMVSGTTFAQGVQAGSDVQMYCGGLNVTQSSLIAPANSALPSIGEGASAEDVFKALSNKKIGTQTPVGSGFQMMLEAALTEAGATGMSWVNVGGNATIAQASLQNASVDATQSGTPGTQQLVESGIAKELVYLPDHSDIFGGMYGQGWVGPAAWLEENPETAKAFCEGTAQALEYIADENNHDEVLALLMKDAGIDDEAVAEQVLKMYGLGYSAALSVDEVQHMFDRGVELGILAPEPALDANELVNTVGR